MNPESKALALHHTSQAIEPQNMSELMQLAKNAAESKFFGAQTPQQALMLMLAGKDLGLSYTQALRSFHVINGKPALSADGMVAVIKARRDICEYFITSESTPERCTVKTKRRDEPESTVTFTLEDARRAGLSGGNWQKFPAAMLKARAKSALARDVYPDLLMGIYDPDEIGHETPSPSPSPMPVVVTMKAEESPSVERELFEEDLRSAQSEEALLEIGSAIKATDLSESDRAALAKRYKAKRAELRAVHEAAKIAEAMQMPVTIEEVNAEKVA